MLERNYIPHQKYYLFTVEWSQNLFTCLAFNFAVMSHEHHGVPIHWQLDYLLTTYLDEHYRKLQSSRQLALGEGIPLIKGPVMGKASSYYKIKMLENIHKWCMVHHCCLTHLPLNKMTAILADNIFLNENDRIWIQISLKFVPRSPIDNNAALVQVMAWHQTGDKPLPETIMVHWCLYATPGGDENTCK